MYISDLSSIDDLSELVGTMNNNMQKALDFQAPLKQKQPPVWTRFPWFTNELKLQKQTARNREQIWKWYRAEHQWTALRVERKRYIAMIWRAKTHMLSSQIIDVGKHTKKLFSLTNMMTGSKKPNPLPPPPVTRSWKKNLLPSLWIKSRKFRTHLMLILNLSLLNRMPASPLITSLHSQKMKLKSHYVHALKILWIGCITNQSGRRPSNHCFLWSHKLSIYG